MKNIHPTLINFPLPIETPRLILRPPKIGEGKILNEAIQESFEKLNKFMLWAKHKPTPDESELIVRQAVANWILKKNDEPYLMLFIIDKSTSEFVGATGYHHFDWDIPSIETGYWIRKKYERHGVMTEAINALTQYAFNQLGVKRMVITCDSNNITSKKIPERLGYTLESVMKLSRITPIAGKIADTLVYVRNDLTDLPNLDVRWNKS